MSKEESQSKVVIADVTFHGTPMVKVQFHNTTGIEQIFYNHSGDPVYCKPGEITTWIAYDHRIKTLKKKK